MTQSFRSGAVGKAFFFPFGFAAVVNWSRLQPQQRQRRCACHQDGSECLFVEPPLSHGARKQTYSGIIRDVRRSKCLSVGFSPLLCSCEAQECTDGDDDGGSHGTHKHTHSHCILKLSHNKHRSLEGLVVTLNPAAPTSQRNSPLSPRRRGNSSGSTPK